MTSLIFDIETDGLIPEMTQVHSLVIKDADDGTLHSCYPTGFKTIEDGLAILAKADVIVGHNIIAFDLPALQKIYPDWKPTGIVRDTLVLGHLLWPELKRTDWAKGAKQIPPKFRGRYSLEAFGHRLGKWKGDYSEDMKAQGLDPWASWNPEMQRYCEQDVEVTLALWNWAAIRIAGKDDGISFSERCIALEHDVATIVTRQEAHGFLFDMKAAEALCVDLISQRLEMGKSLGTLFPPWEVRTPFTPKANNKARGYEKGVLTHKVKTTTFNPNSNDHITKCLKETRGWVPEAFGKDGKPTVDDAILSQLPWPEAQEIAKYKLIQKRIASLSEGAQSLMKAAKKDGRIHGRVQTNGAVTGRMTHSSPPVAGTPKVQIGADKKPILGVAGGYGFEFRSLFISAPGFTLVGCDADALELRCLAHYMAKFDKGAYIKVILEGVKAEGTDMHSVNARAIGLDPQAVYEVDGRQLGGRDITKTWFYAFLYGAGDTKLGSILGMDNERGKKSRADFLHNLPALGQLVKSVNATLNGDPQARVPKRNFLRGLDGRKIYTRSKHAALNTLLQGAGACIMKEALVILDNDLRAAELSPGRDYEFVANVHDEWQIEVKDEHVVAITIRAADAIRQAGVTLDFRCPLAGNSDSGHSGADTH